jgi:hypothetical protein
MTSPPGADRGFPAAICFDDGPVEDHVRQPLVPGPTPGPRAAPGLSGQHLDHLVQVAVGGGPGDAVVAGQRPGGGAVTEPAPAQHRLPEAGQRARLPFGVLRRRRSAASSFATNCTSSLGTSSVARYAITWSLPGRRRSLARPRLPGFHAHLQASRSVRVSTRMSLLAGDKGRMSEPVSRRSPHWPEHCKQVETLLIQGCNGVGFYCPAGVPSPNLLGRRADRVPPNCHQQLSTDIKNWHWHKDRELVSVCGAYVLSRILFRRRSRPARPDIWRSRALTRRMVPSAVPLL